MDDPTRDDPAPQGIPPGRPEHPDAEAARPDAGVPEPIDAPPIEPGAVRAVAELLHAAGHVVVLTGAGVSAESGIDTFRQPQTGLWSRYDPMALASVQALRRDPALVTRWYHWRFGRCARAMPNRGHLALAELERRAHRAGRAFTLLTQNVDGLHQRAGSRNVVELHGSILRWRCERTGWSCGIEQVDFGQYPPRSPAGGTLRPDIVLFGEALPEEALLAAQRAVASCDLMLVVGTSAVVYPAAGFIEWAVERGVPTVEVNPQATAMTAAVTYALAGPSGRVLPALLRCVEALDRSA
ncbi:MAG: NAD-dependent protein deacylase [Phycisphaerales bacterium]|nr:MAG: NAD-dependent protein deacylase [Phycisphaerales bacterium]